MWVFKNFKHFSLSVPKWIVGNKSGLELTKCSSEKHTGKTLIRLFFRSNLIYVCPVCLGFRDRKLLLLEHLPYLAPNKLFLCYCFRFVESYAPHSEQPKLNRAKAELNEGEQVVYDLFTNTEYVEKLVSFLSLEENKAKDKYSSKRMTLFKVIIHLENLGWLYSK